MKAVLALAVFAVFAVIADASVIPSDVNSDLSDIPLNVNSDSSDVQAPYVIEYHEVIDLSNGNFSTDLFSSSRSNLFEGSFSSRDIILFQQSVGMPAVANQVLRAHVQFNRIWPNTISVVRAIVPIFNNGGSAWISAGGVRQQSATVSMESERGRGLYYNVEFWGLPPV